MIKTYQIKPGRKFKLADWDPRDSREFNGNKQEGREHTSGLNARLEELQELLFAERKHKLLVVLQGMDTSGKDGVIRSVFDGVNPQGVQVASFKVPTPIELDHDYLWRIHQQTPARGQIVIFNRSHYEDVLVVRVKNLAPKETWKKRFEHINAFEKMLVDEGTMILKFYLHISHEEQRERLLARLDDPKKRWKFNPADLEDRSLWKEYTKAFEDVLTQTSTSHAPWILVPADRKWYRDLVIASILVESLESLDMAFPVGISEEEVTTYRQLLELPSTD
jgi:PPK2 family polyphosphate:nucleotide phosphotransferase